MLLRASALVRRRQHSVETIGEARKRKKERNQVCEREAKDWKGKRVARGESGKGSRRTNVMDKFEEKKMKKWGGIDEVRERIGEREKGRQKKGNVALTESSKKETSTTQTHFGGYTASKQAGTHRQTSGTLYPKTQTIPLFAGNNNHCSSNFRNDDDDGVREKERISQVEKIAVA